MPIFNDQALSLYIHLPWCVRKCPYCDFNSHELRNNLPEAAYVGALAEDFAEHAPLIRNRKLTSVFFGGGTPSLFSAQAIGNILETINKSHSLQDIEITLEANPGTIDQKHFAAYRKAGINRLSLGIQSLQSDKLKKLGRIHDADQAQRAVEITQQAGFSNFNLDIMYGLPDQSLSEAIADIEAALAFAPTHFSWYQLTLEPNTLFHHKPPNLPDDEIIAEMQMAGQSLLAAHNYLQYEVSAYAQPNKQCKHNLNYWEYGDYLGIGAGAHSKLTLDSHKQIVRFAQIKNPRDYLIRSKREKLIYQSVGNKERIFEFMLNALRLNHGVPIELFTQRTGLPIACINKVLDKAYKKGLLTFDKKILRPTLLGQRFLNDLTAMFL